MGRVSLATSTPDTMTTTTTTPGQEVTLAIETLLPWGPARPIVTAKGHRDLRTYKLKEGSEEAARFWKVWRQAKEQLRAAGISVKPLGGGGDWEAQWWHVPRERIVELARTVEASHAVDAAIDIPRPAGLDFLPYQRGGIAFALDRIRAGKGALIGDEMGLGKTVQAVGVINADPAISRVLVICPATVKINWWRELRKWLARPLTVGIVDSGVWPSTDVVVVNPEVVDRFPKRMEFFWDLVVIDEAHTHRNPKGKRARIIFGHKPTKKETEAGAKPSSGIVARRKLALTGTPVPNKPAEIWPILNWLDPERWGNFYKFATRYCAAVRTRFGFDTSGSSNLDELRRELRGSVMIRRKKSEVLKELPAKTRKIVLLDREALGVDAQRSLLSDFEERMIAIEEEAEFAKIMGDADAYAAAVKKLNGAISAKFSEMSEVRHRVAVAKIPAMIEHVQASIEEHKVVFFAHHRDVLEAMARHFGKRAVLVYGGMTSGEKQASVDAFQNDDTVDLFLGQITAAGVGLTLVASSHVIFGELDWVPGNVTQAEDRCHRIGQKDAVFVEHLVVDGTIDARIAEVIVEKQAVIERSLDGENAELVEMAATPSGGSSVTFREIDRVARRIEEGGLAGEAAAAVHFALRSLAGVCNGAVSWDHVGFNKFDSRIGKALAECATLTPRQAAVGGRLVLKYRRQIGQDLADKIAAALGLGKEDNARN